MNHKRMRPRVNYPIMRKGGKHIVSRKSIRKDGKKETETEKQEYLIERKEDKSEMQPNRTGNVWQGDCLQKDEHSQGVSGTIPRVSPR